MRAYVLISVYSDELDGNLLGSILTIFECSELKIHAADLVTGQNDVICVVSGKKQAIQKAVTDIRLVPGVTRTQTAVSLRRLI